MGKKNRYLKASKRRIYKPYTELEEQWIKGGKDWCELGLCSQVHADWGGLRLCTQAVQFWNAAFEWYPQAQWSPVKSNRGKNFKILNKNYIKAAKT